MKETRRTRWLLAAAASLSVVIGVGQAGAEVKPQPPSAEAGKALAEKLCKGCHLIGTQASAVTPVGPPTFHAMANKPDQTAERIRNVLIVPHAPMPDMQLTKQEIMDLVAFMDSMRTPDAGAPLLKPPAGEKMKYPRAG